MALNISTYFLAEVGLFHCCIVSGDSFQQQDTFHKAFGHFSFEPRLPFLYIYSRLFRSCNSLHYTKRGNKTGIYKGVYLGKINGSDQMGRQWLVIRDGIDIGQSLSNPIMAQSRSHKGSPKDFWTQNPKWTDRLWGTTKFRNQKCTGNLICLIFIKISVQDSRFACLKCFKKEIEAVYILRSLKVCLYIKSFIKNNWH